MSAVNPADGKPWDLRIAHRRSDWIARLGPNHAMMVAYTVPEVLERPTAIFEGLRRDEDDDRDQPGWLAYAGIPRCAYDKKGEEIPAYEKQVFLVFVNHERVAYNWRWEKADPEDPNLPIGYRRRFRRRLM